ncbi:MaoC family dehydratase [Dactylosporangium maewongense]|uniref:MaoC family dehydratase n=1 Tax=Dactylosporangium maewongense TaxID=634393 RepID=A0ABN2DHM9_9ACTN
MTDMRGGPFFEDLQIGQTMPLRSITVTDGLAAAHQAIIGNHLELSLDAKLARDVTHGHPLANPALVWDLAIGASTSATREVIANLFYRRLYFHRFAAIGDRITTSTTVVDKKTNSHKPEKPPTGLVLLRIKTVDQEGRTVLDFDRCAMLPIRRDEGTRLGSLIHQSRVHAEELPAVLTQWNLDIVAEGKAVCTPRGGRTSVVFEVGGDVVSNAPELARLTMNVARVHHDRFASGGHRLVYGGHTIGLTFSQACRAMPEILLPLAWRDCHHIAPVREQDTVWSSHRVMRIEQGPGTTSVYQIQSEAFARQWPSEDPRHVLTWTWTALAQ